MVSLGLDQKSNGGEGLVILGQLKIFKPQKKAWEMDELKLYRYNMDAEQW